MHLKYVIYAGGRPSHGVAKGYGARRTFVVLRGGMFDPQGWTLLLRVMDTPPLDMVITELVELLQYESIDR